MSKIKNQIMEKINKGAVVMRPKEFFTALKILTAIIIMGFFGASVFLFNLSLYVPRRNLGGRYMITRFIADIPWLYLLVGAILLFIGIYMLEKKTNLYKKRTIYVVLGIILAVIISGYLISASNINRRLERKPGWRNFYQDPLKRGQQRMNYNLHFER